MLPGIAPFVVITPSYPTASVQLHVQITQCTHLEVFAITVMLAARLALLVATVDVQPVLWITTTSTIFAWVAVQRIPSPMHQEYVLANCHVLSAQEPPAIVRLATIRQCLCHKVSVYLPVLIRPIFLGRLVLIAPLAVPTAHWPPASPASLITISTIMLATQIVTSLDDNSTYQALNVCCALMDVIPALGRFAPHALQIILYLPRLNSAFRPACWVAVVNPHSKVYCPCLVCLLWSYGLVLP